MTHYKVGEVSTPAHWSLRKFSLPKAIVVWTASFLIVASILCALDFHSESNDSKYYNQVVVQLSTKPIQQWIAPKWLENYAGFAPDEYVRDHLVGHLIPGVLLAKMGVPAAHALTIVQMLFQILSILLLVAIARQFVTESASRVLLWTLQLVPLAMIYGLRANHEQALNFYFLSAMYGTMQIVKNNRGWVWLLVGLHGAFLVKGLLVVVLPFICMAVYVFSALGLSRPIQFKNIAAILACAMSLIVTAASYEFAFRTATGQGFFQEYWRVQIAARSLDIQSQYPFLMQKIYNFAWYFQNDIVYCLPWSLLAAYLTWKNRSRLQQFFADGQFRTLLTILFGSSLLYILAMSVSDRLASRYIFPTYYWSAAGFVLWAYTMSPRLRRVHDWIEKRDSYAVAAIIWLSNSLIHLSIYAIKHFHS